MDGLEVRFCVLPGRRGCSVCGGDREGREHGERGEVDGNDGRGHTSAVEGVVCNFALFRAQPAGEAGPVSPAEQRLRGVAAAHLGDDAQQQAEAAGFDNPADLDAPRWHKIPRGAAWKVRGAGARVRAGFGNYVFGGPQGEHFDCGCATGAASTTSYEPWAFDYLHLSAGEDPAVRPFHGQVAYRHSVGHALFEFFFEWPCPDGG